ncbi:MAG TPA: Holliday junction branch migration protein RuvA [Gemmatimonadales bacterium]|jgi:Holliday junction DNA helicase RuvA|nr:Holliday junction branch migration protein RuvA [Gemmatimonadales bacterium]
MIATLSGVLAEREGETVVIQTDGGVGYAVAVPLGVFERLPARGGRCALYTELVVREDGWTLFGFDSPTERAIFQRLLSASGLGPRLALAILSTLGPDRAVRSIQGKDVAALSTVSGIGKKRAEKLIVELSDRFADLAVAPPAPGASARGKSSDEAVRALAALGYTTAVADEAVRAVLAAGSSDGVEALVRRALQHLTAPKGGRR